MTILAILSLFFIPIFQYCHDLRKDQEGYADPDKGKKLLLATIWINFIIAIGFGLEIAIKSYAFGLRRGFKQSTWVQKSEFFF